MSKTTDKTGPAEADVLVETVETEAVAEATETTAEEVIDLTGFEAAIDEALADADEATGDLPLAAIDKVKVAYQTLPGIKPKTAAKAVLNGKLTDAVMGSDIAKARAFMTLVEKAAVAGKSSSGSTAKPADPAADFKAKVTTLTLAGFLAASDVPEGVDASAVTEAQTLASELFAEATAAYKGEAESENALVKAAVKFAQGKIRKSGQGRVSSGGERRDLGAHIAEAFASVEAGTFLSVADIRKFQSTIYGTDLPSAGAITNRLEPKGDGPTTVAGIKVERRDGKLGAVKQ